MWRRAILRQWYPCPPGYAIRSDEQRALLRTNRFREFSDAALHRGEFVFIFRLATPRDQRKVDSTEWVANSICHLVNVDFTGLGVPRERAIPASGFG